MQYSVFVCGNSIGNIAKLKMLTLKREVINQACYGNFQANEIKILWYVNTKNIDKVDSSVRADIVLQKQDGVTMLPQGLGYSMVGKSHDGPLKTFGFSFINALDTRIYIRPYMKLEISNQTSAQF